MEGFDWDRARQRRASGATSATGAHQSAHRIKEAMSMSAHPRPRAPWRPSHRQYHPDRRPIDPDFFKGSESQSNGHHEKMQDTMGSSHRQYPHNERPMDSCLFKSSDSQSKGHHERKENDSDVLPLLPPQCPKSSQQCFNLGTIPKDMLMRKRNQAPTRHRLAVKAIHLTDFAALKNEDPETAKITDCEFAGSYNWLDTKVPTILIPGAPPMWTPVTGPQQVKEDEGDFLKDQNSARWPEHPLEPAIRAVFDFNPNFKPEEINIVTCTATLGNLFMFASSVPWAFRFDIEKVGNTVFMVRRERKPHDVIKRTNGCRHSFPEANTNWDPSVRGSVSHQRVLQYKLGGLNMLMRYEPNGYIPNLVQKEDEPFEIVERHTTTIKVGTLTEAMESLELKNEEEPGEHHTLRIRQAGSVIPQEALCDIETGPEDKEIDMSDQLPRLWARRTKNLIVAYHKDGFFDKSIMIQDVSADVEEWELKNKLTLSLIAAILKKLVAEVRESKYGKLEVQRYAGGPLTLSAQTGATRDALPGDLKAKWESNNPKVEEDKEETASVCDEEEWDIVNHDGRDIRLKY